MNKPKAEPTTKCLEELEFSYAMREGQQSAMLMVNSKCFLKTFTFAKELLAGLKAALQFPFTVTTEPEIHMLAGKRRRGVMCVMVGITFKLSYDDAKAQLEAAGFTAHIEDTLD